MSTKLKISSAPHAHGLLSTGTIMKILVVSLIPAIILNVYYYGCGILINIVIACLSCALSEALILKIRHKNPKLIFIDFSAIVTGVLIALTIPQLTPWYLTVAGSLFAMIIVKHCYGGLGQNIFNPAMAGFVFLLISCPLPMTTYVNALPGNMNILNLENSTKIIFNIDKKETMQKIQNLYMQNKHIMHNQFEQNVIADGFSGATFLVNSFHEQPSSTVASFTALNMGSFTIFNFQARILICISFILSGLFLAYMKIIDHKITLAFLLTAMAFATICYLINPNKFLPPLYHLIFGATIFGAFFIITDPVTAVSKPKGAWLYGGLIGILFILIRNFGGYPDAMAFSVLLGNAFAPLISIMTRRRIFGYNSKPGDMNE